MGQLLLFKKGLALPKLLDDLRIGLKDELTCKIAGLGGEFARGVHRRQDLEAIALADLIVLLSVAGGDVDTPGALVLSDELTQNDLHLAIDPGMAAENALQLCTRPCA